MQVRRKKHCPAEAFQKRTFDAASASSLKEPRRFDRIYTCGKPENPHVDAQSLRAARIRATDPATCVILRTDHLQRVITRLVALYFMCQ